MNKEKYITSLSQNTHNQLNELVLTSSGLKARQENNSLKPQRDLFKNESDKSNVFSNKNSVKDSIETQDIYCEKRTSNFYDEEKGVFKHRFLNDKELYLAFCKQYNKDLKHDSVKDNMFTIYASKTLDNNSINKFLETLNIEELDKIRSFIDELRYKKTVSYYKIIVFI